MLTSDRDKQTQAIEQLIDEYGGGRDCLLPVLQAIQQKHRFISEYAMQVVADRLAISPVEVYGVVSFYSFLNQKPKGNFIVRLCQTISCNLQGKDRVARQLQNELGINFGQTTEDGLFTLEWASCLGMCDQGPAMLVNEQIFTRVTPEKVYDILEGCRKAFVSYSSPEQEEPIA